MSSDGNRLAFISVKILTDPLSSFGKELLDWRALTDQPISHFDFDNFSEPYTIDLAYKLLDESDRGFISIHTVELSEQVSGIGRFLNMLTRKYRDSSTVVYSKDHHKLQPYLKVLKARKYVSQSELEEAFKSWINIY